ncbi:Phosphorelay protein LuxU [Vibrio crassostreae]|nr:Phosphorelay protein LuxU [Vibrio crassostreae]
MTGKTRATKLSLSILILSLSVTIMCWSMASDYVENNAESHFTNYTQEVKALIQNRMLNYKQVLSGGVALFAASEHVNRKEWAKYIDKLHLGLFYPGIQGIGVSIPVSAQDKEAHVWQVRAEGFPQYDIKPNGIRNEYTTIIYLEPFDERNRQAFGFDMYSEAVRRQAMARARDTGQAALSGRVELVQESPEDKQAGFLLYLPIYKTTYSPETLEERRKSFVGYVYSPFRTTDLMQGILQSEVSTVSFRVYDGADDDPSRLLYDGNNALNIDKEQFRPAFRRSEVINVSGRDWTLIYTSTPVFEAALDFTLPRLVAATGGLLSILFFFLIRMLMVSHQTAERLNHEASARREAEGALKVLNHELESRVSKRTQELKQQEELNRMLLESLSEGVEACDSDGNLTLFNRTAREWYGSDPSLLLPEQWSNYYNLYEVDNLTPLAKENIPLLRAFNGEHIQNEEFCVVAKGQSPRFVLANGAPIHDIDGNRLGAVLAMHDVTENRRHERRFSDIFEFAPDAMLMIERDGGITQANSHAEVVFGWRKEAIKGQPIECLLPGISSEIKSYFFDNDEWGEGERVKQLSATVRRKEGEDVPVDISLSPVESEKGLQVAVAIRDITQRVQSERANKEAMAMLNAIEDGAFIFDPETLRHSYVNEGAVCQLGYSREELLELTVVDFKVDYDENRYRKLMEPLLNGEQKVIHLSTVHKHKDGHLIPVEVSLQYLSLPGGKRRCISMVRDVTERYQALQQLEEAAKQQKVANLIIDQERKKLTQRVSERTASLRATNEKLEQARTEAEQASLAKSAFLAAMSHEIRTPMNGVIGMLDVLSHRRLDSQQMDEVKIIHDSAFDLLGLIDDILDFSKIEAGKLDLEQLPVSVEEVVEGVCTSLLSVSEKQDVDLQLFIAPTFPSHILSDPTRLRQIFYNLIGNAIKFSCGREEKRGDVSIRVNIVDSKMVVNIEDNGIGMSAEALAMLFTSFSQAESSTTRRFGGSGLGLAITKRLVDLMNGGITVNSKLGKGAMFTVSLPCEVNKKAVLPPSAILSNTKCILVEGSTFKTDDLRVYLEHSNANVRVVSNYPEALRLAESLEDIVVIIIGAPKNAPELTADFLKTLNILRSESGHIRHLLINRDQLRPLAFESPDLVILNGNLLRRQEFLRSVAVAAGVISPEIILEKARDEYLPLTAGLSVAQARTEGRLILVAEDDSINRKVILKQLNILGYAAEVAENGLLAHQLWQEGNYALLLTDLHMPGLDGYGLTEAIRKQESELTKKPILALTANALRGEKNRAKAVGMDDYLTKPVQLHLLKEVLEKWLPNQNGAIIEEEQIEHTEILAVSKLAELVGDEPVVIGDFLVDFLSLMKMQHKQLRVASVAKDSRKVSSIVHKLKSSSRSVGAMRLGDLCAELENACTTDDAVVQALTMTLLEKCFADTEEEVVGYLDKTNHRGETYGDNVD